MTLLFVIIVIINLLSCSVKSDEEVNRVDKKRHSNNAQYPAFSSSAGIIVPPPRTLTETTRNDDYNNNTIPNARIVDGYDVTDYSTASFFVRPANLNKVCGGALIHDDMVVTAAHCVEAFQQQGVLVYNPRTKDYTTRIDIDWYNIHPNHSSQQLLQQQRTPPLTTHDNDSPTTTTTTTATSATEPRTNNNGNTSPPSVNFDFAIMRLSRPVVETPSSTSIQPIPINIDPTIPKDNELLQAFGFGRIEADNPTKRPTRLQVGDFVAISNEECRSRVKHMTPDVQNAIQEDILCVDPLSSESDQQSSVCRGDSGGPLIAFDDDRMSSPVLVGLVVFGHGCIADRIPDGFARISYYADYIMDHLCSMSRVSHVDCPDDYDNGGDNNNNYLDGSTATKQPTNRPSSIAHPSPKPSPQSMAPSNYPSLPPSILLPTNIPTIDATPLITLSPSNNVNDADTILSLSKNPSRGNDGRLSGKIGGGYIRNDRPRPRTPSQSSTTISPTTTEEERNGNDDHGG